MIKIFIVHDLYGNPMVRVYVDERLHYARESTSNVEVIVDDEQKLVVEPREPTYKQTNQSG